jgi:putrescine aminotransferase
MSSSVIPTEDISRLYRDHINPDLARLLKLSGLGTVEMSAQGSWITDHKGVEYLDFCGGYGVFSLGHRHPAVVNAVREQLDQMPLASRVFFSAPTARLASELARVAPGDLRYTFFCNSGTEAVEGALKLARLATGRAGLVAAENAFHGKTFGSLSVSGRSVYQEPFSPLLAGVSRVPFGDLEALSQTVDEATAAVILEPVQGEGGIHVAPDGYLRGAADICRERGALLIADEVQTGLGRTGRMFAVEHWDICPDIICLAKALGGGVMPIGAFMGTTQVWKAWRGRPTLHTSTFGGNPLACAAGLATLKALEDEDLCERAAASGEYLRTRLEEVQSRFPQIVKEVRGMGLLMGVEFTDEKFTGSILMAMVQRRVLTVHTMNQPRVLRLEPALNVTRAEIDTAVAALDASLAVTRERFFKETINS